MSAIKSVYSLIKEWRDRQAVLHLTDELLLARKGDVCKDWFCVGMLPERVGVSLEPDNPSLISRTAFLENSLYARGVDASSVFEPEEF